MLLLILNQVIGCSGNVIHFAAYKWWTPSIKDIELIGSGPRKL